MEKVRIGFFVCHCGTNIGGFLDVPELAKYALSLPHVALSQENMYLCADAGLTNIRKAIKKNWSRNCPVGIWKATGSKGHFIASSTDGAKVNVAPVGGQQVNPKFNGVTTPYYVYDKDGTVLDNNNLDIAGNLAANTWYYAYIYYFTGGLLAPAGIKFEISTTPPDVYRLFKTGDPSRRYLFPFRTDGGAAKRR